jgi:CRP-like cAMP-binding protein
VILPLLTLVTWRRLVEIDRTLPIPPPELALIEGVPMFAPLSLAVKEQIAAGLIRLSVPAGEVVIRAGDLGDRFYVIADGELEVIADGLHRSADAGDYFGEIALLRDMPRTATVRAIVDSTLYALERDAFLQAVTGNSSMRAANAIVEARLAATGASGSPR